MQIRPSILALEGAYQRLNQQVQNYDEYIQKLAEFYAYDALIRYRLNPDGDVEFDQAVRQHGDIRFTDLPLGIQSFISDIDSDLSFMQVLDSQPNLAVDALMSNYGDQLRQIAKFNLDVELTGGRSIEEWDAGLDDAAMFIASILFEPVDWALTGYEVYQRYNQNGRLDAATIGLIGLTFGPGSAQAFRSRSSNIFRSGDDFVDSVISGRIYTVANMNAHLRLPRTNFRLAIGSLKYRTNLFRFGAEQRINYLIRERVRRQIVSEGNNIPKWALHGQGTTSTLAYGEYRLVGFNYEINNKLISINPNPNSTERVGRDIFGPYLSPLEAFDRNNPSSSWRGAVSHHGETQSLALLSYYINSGDIQRAPYHITIISDRPPCRGQCIKRDPITGELSGQIQEMLKMPAFINTDAIYLNYEFPPEFNIRSTNVPSGSSWVRVTRNDIKVWGINENGVTDWIDF